jgi:hypothetical protein
MKEKWPDVARGERLTAERVNQWQQAIERGGNRTVGPGLGGVSTSTFESLGLQAGAPFVLARLTAPVVGLELSRLNVPPGTRYPSSPSNPSGPSGPSGPWGKLPPVFNAVPQVWDDDVTDWVDLVGGDMVVENPFGHSYDQNALVPCALYQGRWVICSYNPVRVLRTVKDPKANAGAAWYPPSGPSGPSGPRVYAAALLNVPYPPVPGWSGPITAQEMKPPNGPHLTVWNLAPNNDYIPENTVVWAFESNGRWFTFYQAPGAASGGVKFVELDLSPSVANVTEVRLPNGSLTDLGGGVVQLTFPAGSSLGVAANNPGTGDTPYPLTTTGRLYFDQTSGLAVATVFIGPGPGDFYPRVAAVPAGATHQGVVTTGSQTFAGGKTFTDFTLFSGGLRSNGINLFTTTTVNGGSVYIRPQNTDFINNVSGTTTVSSLLSFEIGGGTPVTTQIRCWGSGGTTNANYIDFMSNTSSPALALRIGLMGNALATGLNQTTSFNFLKPDSTTGTFSLTSTGGLVTGMSVI